MNYIVYKVTFPNNKVYVGITSKGLEVRKKQHYKESKRMRYNYKFYNALIKYEEQEIREEVCCGLTWEDTKELEKYFIQYYNSYNGGYNLSSGGDGNVGRKLSEEEKERLRGPRPRTSKALKGKPKSEEHKRNLSEACKGRKISEEAKQKISIAMRKRNSSLEFRNGVALKGGGKPFKVFKIARIQKPTQGKKAIYEKIGFIGEWISQRQCARDLNLNQSDIGKCLRKYKNNKIHKGYIFEYVEEN